MIVKINIARSNMYSATVSVDGKHLEQCESNEGCSYYKTELDSDFHKVEVAIRKIIKRKGEGPLTGGLNLVTGNIRATLEDSKMVKYCYDIKVEDGKDTLYINHDGKLLSSMTSVDVLDEATLTRYEPEEYKSIVRFGVFLMIPLILLTAAFCLYNGITVLIAKAGILQATVMLITGGLMAILGAVYSIKLLMLKAILKKFTKSEDYYDKL